MAPPREGPATRTRRAVRRPSDGLQPEKTAARAIKYTVPSAAAAGDTDGSLSVIIPAYNESENIVATLENLTTALEPLALPHEILVIDDGSQDNTAALVEASAVRFPRVRLLKNERNMGFGWSYRRGVEAASLAHVVMVHGDNAWGVRRSGSSSVTPERLMLSSGTHGTC